MTRYSQIIAVAGVALTGLISVGTVEAHPGHTGFSQQSWLAGALHPILGLDHLLAVLASGLIAIRVRTRHGLWLIPLSFLGLMLLGGLLAWIQIPVLITEWGILVSVIVLALSVALFPGIPLFAGIGLVGVFAVCHGYAHVLESTGSLLFPYLCGLMISTFALHLLAMGMGILAVRCKQPQWISLAGGGIAVCFMMSLLLA